MFTAFWGEQQAAVAIVAAACIFLRAGGSNGFDCLRRGWVGSLEVEEERRPHRRQSDDHHFGSLLMLAVTAGAFILVTWIATKGLLVVLQEAPLP
jgi:hypothetical protein